MTVPGGCRGPVSGRAITVPGGADDAYAGVISGGNPPKSIVAARKHAAILSRLLLLLFTHLDKYITILSKIAE